MKKILGLDLGVTSIGWALLAEKENESEIIGMGSRIIPLSNDDKDEFSSGNKISKNQKRTQKRTQRKGYDRYQLRRRNLTAALIKNNMFDETLFKLNALNLWGLRAKAAQEIISLKELGRVLYHLNQKRGYKSSRSDANLDKKDTEYVAEVKNRHQQLNENGLTIGQKFYFELQKDQYYRIKQQVFPREAYIEEFDAIMVQQKIHYPQILTNEFIEQLRNEIIYYQRKLKSQKGLVSVCEFEGFWTKTKEGREIFVGPKVAPKSSPLFQVCKIWETINNIILNNKRGDRLEISMLKKKEIFEYLNNNEKLSQTELFKILELKKGDGWYHNKMLAKGLRGNITKSQLLKYLDINSPLLEFNLLVEEKAEETFLVDRKSGEIVGANTKKFIIPEVENQPMYKLWHTIYSISETDDCTKTLMSKFNLEKEIAGKLANIDFTKSAFGNKSAKAMREILPYLMEGYGYSDACSFAGFNHSNSLTNDENFNRKLLDTIPLLAKNSLRQPIVEKILNQLINVVNAIINKYGKPDEIRIELARELKQSREERNDSTKSIEANERINEEISKRLLELNINPTRKIIEKYKFIFPIRTVINKDGSFNKKSFDNAKVCNQCIYCGESFALSDALFGNDFDVDHIIPKSLLFDDSQSNRVLVHRKCNADDKKNKTAYDFIRAKGEEQLANYLERLDHWFTDGIISYTKLQRLKISNEDYLQRKKTKSTTESDKNLWENFIQRQLRETQYIAKKAKEILGQISHNVWSTSGSITSHLRKIWGWDDVLMNLQINKYRELGFTEQINWETNDGQKHKKEIIKDWTKRDDHRHHAVDALVIACTQQGFIQRINTLNSQHTRDEMFAEVGKIKEKNSLLDSYLISKKPFTTKQVEEKASEVLVSFKAGKKVATIGIRKIKKGEKKIVAQTDIIVPRGTLSEESVYGRIKAIEKKKSVKFLFENPHLIFKPYIKSMIENRLAKYENDVKKSLASLKTEPIYLDAEKTILLEYGTCYKEEYVIKYPLESIKSKDTKYIIDEKIKSIVIARLEKYNNKEKEAFKEPLYFNEENKIPIKSVRMFTGLSAVEPVKKDDNGKNIGFVKPGNNHHIAFYIDENGNTKEHLCTFWHAVERKKYGIPIIIKNTTDIWDRILSDDFEYPESFLEKLPGDKLTFNLSLQQNEMFVLGLEQDSFEEAVSNNDLRFLTDYIYRVQKMSIKGNGQIDIWFRKHLETQLIDTTLAKESKKFYNVQSVGVFMKLNPLKIIINNLGEILK